jgi:hypothetical protein
MNFEALPLLLVVLATRSARYQHYESAQALTATDASMFTKWHFITSHLSMFTPSFCSIRHHIKRLDVSEILLYIFDKSFFDIADETPRPPCYRRIPCLLRCRFSNIVFDEQQIVLYATLNEF